MVRVDKILSNLGYCSRSNAPEYIKKNPLYNKNIRVLKPSDKVIPGDLRINDTPLDHVDGLFLILNKPAGYICTHDISEGRRVYDLLPGQWMERNPQPSTVGRLDKDTTGVLLITDQTTSIHQLTSSKNKVEKVYQVVVDKLLSPALVQQFASGTIMLTGEANACLPATLRITSENSAEVVLTEGKYHQVKRMFGHFGYTVIKLHRSRFGAFTVENLPEGTYYELPVSSLK